MGAFNLLLRPLTECANFKINFRSDEASLRRAPWLTSYAGIFRAEFLPLSGEGGHWQGEACPVEKPQVCKCTSVGCSFLVIQWGRVLGVSWTLLALMGWALKAS